MTRYNRLLAAFLAAAMLAAAMSGCAPAQNGEDGVTPYTETGSLTVKRTVPDLLYVCENENRLWGCDKTTIYASKLGDIFNWNVYDGMDP